MRYSSALIVCGCCASTLPSIAATVHPIANFPLPTSIGLQGGGAWLVPGPGNVVYGLTPSGGKPHHSDFANGGVFTLTPPQSGHGHWSKRDVYDFNWFKGSPVGPPAQDAAGNLYLGTFWGYVLRLEPPPGGSGAWHQSVLRNLSTGTVEAGVNGGVVLGADGALYMPVGGTSWVYGGVLRVAPPSSGKGEWRVETLWNCNNNDGAYPQGALTFGADGALYGTTSAGGAHGAGTIFRLVPPSGAGKAWTHQDLHDFSGSDGDEPIGGLVADGNGTWYGTALATEGYGVAFSLAPPAAGQTLWQYTALHYFTGSPNDANNIAFPLILQPDGSLIGSSRNGGDGGFGGWGVVFQLSPPAQGQTQWTEQILVDFNTSTTAGGVLPYGNLLQVGGRILGTTTEAGRNGTGNIFLLTP